MLAVDTMEQFQKELDQGKVSNITHTEQHISLSVLTWINDWCYICPAWQIVQIPFCGGIQCEEWIKKTTAKYVRQVTLWDGSYCFDRANKMLYFPNLMQTRFLSISYSCPVSPDFALSAVISMSKDIVVLLPL